MAILRTVYLRRDANGHMLVYKNASISLMHSGECAATQTQPAIGRLPSGLSVLDFIARYRPDLRPGVELVVHASDLGHSSPVEETKLTTVTALRKALRNPAVTRVYHHTTILGERRAESLPISRVKRMLKHRAGWEPIANATLIGNTIRLEG